MEKTNVMRILDQKKINYKYHEYNTDGINIDGMHVAKYLNIDDNKVFKTIVTVSNTKKYYVFLVPVNKEIDLKKAAVNACEKKIELIPTNQLLSLTGYVRGGCSPIGMKKQFKTFISIDALNHDTIVFSAGKIGYQVEIKTSDLEKIINVSFVSI